MVCSFPNWLGCSAEVRADQRTVSMSEEKHQTVQGATVEAREYLERAASTSEAWHSELGKDKAKGRWRRKGNQSHRPGWQSSNPKNSTS